MQDEALYKYRLLLSEDPGLQVGFKGVQVLTHRRKAIWYRHEVCQRAIGKCAMQSQFEFGSVVKGATQHELAFS